MFIPDCRVDFIDNMNKAVKFGTWEGIEIIAPYSSITKRDIAEIAKKMDYRLVIYLTLAMRVMIFIVANVELVLKELRH